ncbi:MAG: four helix bundle protein [Actinomycetota bacterium]|nr:four helix bundle protein [Actinomycetota bacterium]
MNPEGSEIFTKIYQLCAEVNGIAQDFPEDGYVTHEIRTNAILIPLRITRGHENKRPDRFIEDLYEAYAYLLDLESQILLTRKLGYIDYGASQSLKEKLGNLLKMLRMSIESSEENVSRKNKDKRNK